MPLRKSTTVLVVEREPQVLHVLQEILARAGFMVLPARSGEGALRLYEQHQSKVDLLLIDCQPPEIAQLTRRHPGLKVLGLSGSAGAEFASDVPVLNKPFTARALVGAIRSVLGAAPPQPVKTAPIHIAPEVE